MEEKEKCEVKKGLKEVDMKKYLVLHVFLVEASKSFLLYLVLISPQPPLMFLQINNF